MRLTVVRGIPGSGKSTFAREYAATQTRSGVETVHVESDDYFVVGTHYLWDAGLLKAAHQRCYRMTEKLLEQGIAVVVANTFTTTGEMQGYVDLAEDFMLQLKVYRMENRFGSIHNVPAEVIEKMTRRFTDFPGELTVRATEHRCGLSGFDPMKGDRCPACDNDNGSYTYA
jgi:predicted kinase